ncbi:RNA polymerase subunit sigma-70 [Bacillus coahuilensis m2-6]|uniref:RNA polymerase subunit sigma-70 n=2 Tax=Bacillus coahuilensis TaxID=408580 RepID=A0A147K6Y2_9BACI|nr:hypothetical protein [Bacillus coahuilensis]KUP05827.1 RNA polymerase subunit sigma-70 [Bacillus coahuilensis p1.1.43]KUP07295.1 RNA polymerase subunit sigma-70 [Bacillus coahuilensis m2-6]
MRASEKQSMNSLQDRDVFGLDFHHFLEKEKSSNSVELASEFGLSLREVRMLKKKLEEY